MIHDAGPAKGRLERMRTRFPDADAVVFGHSHMPLHESDPSGFQIFNPGSPTERRRAPTHTMGIAQARDGRVEFELVELTEAEAAVLEALRDAQAARSCSPPACSRSALRPAAPATMTAEVIRRAPSRPTSPAAPSAEAVEVIDGWSTALREGDVEAAADYLELPSIAQNGTPPLDLETRDDVIAFNEALPCGAELVEAIEHAGFVIATFELTERPGGDCGEGVGGEAQTAFQIEDGKITEWQRTGDADSLTPSQDAPIV